MVQKNRLTKRVGVTQPLDQDISHSNALVFVAAENQEVYNRYLCSEQRKKSPCISEPKYACKKQTRIISFLFEIVALIFFCFLHIIIDGSGRFFITFSRNTYLQQCHLKKCKNAFFTFVFARSVHILFVIDLKINEMSIVTKKLRW